MQMATTENATATLARFITDSSWGDIPERVKHEAKRALLNFMGAALGGSHDLAIEHAIAALGQFSGPPQASVIGRTQRFDLLNAAFLNAASGNVLDYDDTHHPTVVHPTSPVAPVLLALAEHAPMSGAGFLHALILGIETACRLGQTVSPQHYVRGWHITSTCGVVGAAAAAAKALHLDLEATTNALGLGANQACGLVESLGSMAKSLSVGNAARNGMLAAWLAREGFTAAPATLEGPRGFAHVMADDPRLRALTDGLGERWEVLNNALKPYPSGVVLHPVIDACLEIMLRHRPAPDQITRVIVRGNPLLRQRADRPVPRSGREASVSAQHSVAVCFLFGDAGVTRYTEACVRDPSVQRLGNRVHVEDDAALAVESAQVSVRMNDGATYNAYVAHALGSLARPMTDAQVETKVRTLAAPHDLSVDQLIETVWRLDAHDDATAVLTCALPRRSSPA
jgi:2-methylcitrate dehydratase PrpD